MVIDLPFEGRKVERSWKYRGRERVPKVGSRREETITEPINYRIGEFHTIVVGKCCLACGTWPSHWRWNTGGQFIRTVTKVIAAIVKKEVSQGPGVVSASCMEVIKRPHCKTGFSKAITEVVASDLKRYTACLYLRK